MDCLNKTLKEPSEELYAVLTVKSEMRNQQEIDRSL